MKHLFIFIFVLIAFIRVSYTAPVDDKNNNKESKSAFGPAFDEIVVESHLTVRRKPNGRQSRTQNTTTEAGIIKTKREIKLPLYNHQISKSKQLYTPNIFQPIQFGASAASSQAQAFNNVNPLGSFGASASGTQTQSFGLGPNGFTGTGAFSGTQQYHFNGQTIDISFGSAVSNNGQNNGAASTVTITGPDGKKRPING